MKYNSWKLMSKIDVAVRARDTNYRGFNGYVVEHGDKSALEKAKDWARERSWNRDKNAYDDPIEPNVHTFDNEGFTATIMQSAGGSYQGGRLSFWMCQVEKDGIKFNIGVNDAILADLIKNSDISNGVIKQKVMFARKGGQPGLIHENMDAYTEAVADMKQKADLKKAKKTSKWEIGGVYKTLTQMSICLGEVLDTYEEYEEVENPDSWYRSRKVTKFRKRKTPLKTTAWIHVYRFQDQSIPESFNKVLTKELKDRNYVYFHTGKPPARNKAAQLEVTKADLKLIDKILSLRTDGDRWSGEVINGRFVRELK